MIVTLAWKGSLFFITADSVGALELFALVAYLNERGARHGADNAVITPAKEST
jgi:hypothetical protein